MPKKKESTDLENFFCTSWKAASVASLCHWYADIAAERMHEISNEDLEEKQAEILKLMNLLNSAEELFDKDRVHAQKIDCSIFDKNSIAGFQRMMSIMKENKKLHSEQLKRARTQKIIDLIIDILRLIRGVYLYLTYKLTETEPLTDEDQIYVSSIGVFMKLTWNNLFYVIMNKFRSYLGPDFVLKPEKISEYLNI